MVPLVRLSVAVLLAVSASSALAQAPEMPAVPVVEVIETAIGPQVYRAHAIAMHGEPKFGPDFTHFDYVNPDAPKGGVLRLSASGTFDSFHPYIPKGRSGPTGSVETLLTQSADEPFTMYGLIAETIEWPEDRSWVTFTLRPEARWHDGRPITVEDVIWTLETLRTKGRPLYRFYYGDVERAEKVGERQVKFSFSSNENRELPLIVGQMPVLPKHYWETRDFESTTLEPPLGSGPYRVKDFEAARYIVLERVEDYWGEDLPVNRGQDNFDIIRYDFYLDPTVIRQAVKASKVDVFAENSAKEWTQSYEGRALDEGFLKKEQFLDKSSGRLQAFFMNTRRPPFDNRKLRQALAYAFDFEWTNRTLYYDSYLHGASFFAPTELASSGLPQGEELEILERYRDRLPPEVFTEAYKPPETDGSGWPRDNLREAFRLLDAAGWEVRDLKMVNRETGQPLRFEFMIQQQSLERVLLPFQRNLARLGIEMRIRFVDTSQYINRLREFDFDMIVFGIGQALSPGNEQRAYWGSAAADQPGSRNISGIKDPLIDELIEQVITAPTRESLVARTRALDRVLLWGHYVIPNLVSPYDRIVHWDRFGMPEKVPLNGPSTNYWWFDPAKAAVVDNWRAQTQDVPSAQDDSGSDSLMRFALLGILLMVAAVAFRWAMRRPAS